jgi:hypothetical protein
MFRKFREGREKRREEQEKQRLENERAKWLTVPIERDHRVDPPPSFEELADRAIQRAGAEVEFSYDAVLAYWSNFLFVRMAGIMERDSQRRDSLLPSNTVHGLRAIRERDDFEPRMLWDYLTMQGTQACGLHMALAKQIQADGLIEVVATRIRRGELCDVDEAVRLSANDADKTFQLSDH